jgi:hypothetical protein
MGLCKSKLAVVSSLNQKNSSCSTTAGTAPSSAYIARWFKRSILPHPYFFRTHRKAPVRKTRYSQHNNHYSTHMKTTFEGRYEGEDARKSEEDGVQGASIPIEGARNALC